MEDECASVQRPECSELPSLEQIALQVENVHSLTGTDTCNFDPELLMVGQILYFMQFNLNHLRDNLKDVHILP